MLLLQLRAKTQRDHATMNIIRARMAAAASDEKDVKAQAKAARAQAKADKASANAAESPQFETVPTEFLNFAAQEVFPDVFLVPDMLQQMGFNADRVFGLLQSIPLQDVDKPIVKDFYVPILIPGTHAALHFRGQPLPRAKGFFQVAPEAGLRRYGYPGWQYRIAHAMKDIKSVVQFDEILEKLNFIKGPETEDNPPDFNSLIATLYESGADYIGAHSDRPGDLFPEGWIGVIRLGAPRNFRVFNKTSSKTFCIPAGGALFMSFEANARYKHELPPMTDVEASGSLVFRAVKTCMKWANVDKQAAKEYKVQVSEVEEVAVEAPGEPVAVERPEEEVLEEEVLEEEVLEEEVLEEVASHDVPGSSSQVVPEIEALPKALPKTAAAVRAKACKATKPYIGSMDAFMKQPQK